jgi:hypothetical protein
MMELTGVTDEMLAKARDEIPGGFDAPLEAIAEATKAIHEHCVACFDEHDDPQRSWDQMNEAQRQSGLDVGVWLIHRLELAGFKVVKA